ncbi:hypothetical protein PH562_16715 [Rhizobium sp. CNPSo 4062]|uniref:hypothetical protein n=1 Tax=Rhizobium sp. CNPSo 4062 TaxID=3021410 RepID=UPI0025517784|nr:hypothetical protein [Rhizobium sp. CNPSo 4062]MDK4703895.1 hypothetical protein [Rhizobium sp. CNPSo 4062]
MSVNAWLHTDWSLIDFEDKKKEAPVAAAEPAETPKGSCPKCGKHIGKGLHMHMKGCNGHSGQAH